MSEFPLAGRAMADMGEQLQAERAKVAKLRSSLTAARVQIAAIPTREEWLGGQRTKYVQVADVLYIVDEALKAPVDVETCRARGHGQIVCPDCGTELVGLETVRDRQRIAQLMEDTVEPEGTAPAS